MNRKVMLVAALASFATVGALQYTGAISKTTVGELSISAMKLVRGAVISDSTAACRGFGRGQVSFGSGG